MATLAEQLGFIPWLFRAVMMFVMDNIMPKFVRRKMLESKGLSGRYFQTGLFLLKIWMKISAIEKIFSRKSTGKAAEFEDFWWNRDDQTYV